MGAGASDRGGAWTEIRIHVPLPRSVHGDDAAADRYLEPLIDSCVAVSPDGVAVEGADAPPGGLIPPPAPDTARLRVFVPPAQLEAAVSRVSAGLAGYDGARVTTCGLDDDWKERWKAFFEPFEVSRRLAVRAPWHTWRAHDDQKVVVIDPSMAFGTGQHETTRLCLDRIDELCADTGTRPESLLDVGCGSGILSIAAVMADVGHVVGVDTDPDAVRIAAENAERNSVDGTIDWGPAISAVDQTFDVVVANILTHILVELREALVARVRAGGRLIVSGILADQVDDLVSAFGRAGVEHRFRRRLGEWVLVEFHRP